LFLYCLIITQSLLALTNSSIAGCSPFSISFCGIFVVLTILFNEHVKDVVISIDSYDVDIQCDDKTYIIHHDKHNIKASQNMQKPWHHLFIDFNNDFIKMIISIVENRKYKFTEKHSHVIFKNGSKQIVLLKSSNSEHNIIKHYY